MATKSGGNNIDYWRDYFRTASSGIFDIIEHSIMVAASDSPKEFRLRRERIAELLFSCRLTRCLGCDRVELTESRVDDDDEGEEEEDDDEGFKIKGREIDEHGRVGSKGSSKVNSISGNDHGEIGGEMEMINQYDPESNFSYGDAEALSDEIEEEREIVGEVLRIKEILQNSQDESDSVLFESLRRLQLMALNVDILKATEIGKAVNGIRRHNSKQIRHLARALIDGWKIIVDEWVKATQEIAEGGTPDSVNPSTVEEEEEDEEEEEGLPSPPMDEAFLFGNQNMELSEFFDGMDDDGNPRNCGEFNKNREVGRRKPFVAKQDAPKRRQEPPKEATPLSKENNRVPQMKRQVPLPKPNRPSNTQSGPGRPVKPNGDPKLSRDSRVPQKPEKPMIQRRPAPPAERSRSSDPDAVQEKLEATKRKLQERYQQAENAKRQRTIQVMELHDLPKQQGLVNKNTQGKFGNHSRNWANARR